MNKFFINGALLAQIFASFANESHAVSNVVSDPTLHSGWSRFSHTTTSGLYDNDNIEISSENTLLQFTGSHAQFVEYYLYPYIEGIHTPAIPVKSDQIDQGVLDMVDRDAKSLVDSYLDGYKAAWAQSVIMDYAFGDEDLGILLNKNREGYERAKEDRKLFFDGIEAGLRDNGDIQSQIQAYQVKWHNRHGTIDESEFFIAGYLFTATERLNGLSFTDDTELLTEIEKFKYIGVSHFNFIGTFFDQRKIEMMKNAMLSGGKFVSGPNAKVRDLKLLNIDVDGKKNARMILKSLDLTIHDIYDKSSSQQMSIEFDKIFYWDYDWKDGDHNQHLSNIASRLEITGRNLSGLKEIYFGVQKSKEISPGVFLSGSRDGTVRFSNSVTYDGYIYSQGDFENDPLGTVEINSNVRFSNKIGYNPNKEEYARIAKIAMINVLPDKRLSIKDDVYIHSGISLNKNSRLIIDASTRDITLDAGINNAYITDDGDGTIKAHGSNKVVFLREVGGDDARVGSIKFMGNGDREFTDKLFVKSLELEMNRVTLNSSVNTGDDGSIVFKNDGIIYAKDELISPILSSYPGLGTVILENGQDIYSIGSEDSPIKTLVIPENNISRTLHGSIYATKVIDSMGNNINDYQSAGINLNGYSVNLFHLSNISQGLVSDGFATDAELQATQMMPDNNFETSILKNKILEKIRGVFSIDQLAIIFNWLDEADIGSLNMLDQINETDLIRVIDAQNILPTYAPATVVHQSHEEDTDIVTQQESQVAALQEEVQSPNHIFSFIDVINSIMNPAQTNQNNQQGQDGNIDLRNLRLQNMLQRQNAPQQSASPNIIPPMPPLNLNEARRVVTRSVSRNISNRMEMNNSLNSGEPEFDGMSSGSSFTDFGLWSQGFIGSAYQQKNATQDAYNASAYGLTIGLDAAKENGIIGVSISGISTDLEFEDKTISASKNNFANKIISLYGQYKLTPKLNLSAQVGYGSSNLGTQDEKKEGYILAGEFEMKYKHHIADKVILTPKFEIEYNGSWYKEKDNKETDHHSCAFEIGSAISKSFKVADYSITPSLYLGCEMLLSGSENLSLMNGIVSTQEITGSKQSKSNTKLLGILDASLNIIFSKVLKTNLGFNYSKREDFSSLNGYLKVMVSF